MNWTGAILALAALILFFQVLTWRTRDKSKRLPPGPRGLPIIGNLLMIGSKPHRDLLRLAHKYGPIMHLRYGMVPVIVVSSPEAAELFLKTHDLVFASRPPHEASKCMCYNQQNLAFSPYGSYWRNMRKMCTLELLSNRKINSFGSMRKQELDLLVRHIRKAADGGGGGGVVVDLSSMVTSFSTDVSCRMIIGKKYNRDDSSEKGIAATLREVVKTGAAFNLADYIPQIKGLDLQGLTKRMKAIAKDFDDFCEKIIEEHVQSKDENRVKDFVDVMLGFVRSEETHEYRVERDTIKAIILDMLAAAMDSSAATIDWTLTELIRHPRVMKKLQTELESVVGMNRMVEESDLEKLGGCPGMQLGLTIVRLVVAQLAHCFDWELPDNKLPTELDMTEDFGIVCPRAEHLQLIPTWRLEAF
ncbi:TRANSPARENT TESTA 7, CYTOCHROME P450 75B1 [Hibiscus trionum]|uniref:TRANSPARENT TESTA 7, CYTOCHROME P450 75B1 n=1 Tax=Hibiscus trionum TaxID=183268 RepID=A0A9W7MCY4_HIBTR|nr:TRANSPARENT TESTA 7, CYTOCHROME P450 75B1 [Hibiscus trionum]